jgi:Ca2+-binding EF-hand superfamily protein
MKKLVMGSFLALASATASSAEATLSTFAVDRVARFDLNGDRKISYEELSKSCKVSTNLFEIADKNDDSFLTNRELRDAKSYLLSQCKK